MNWAELLRQSNVPVLSDGETTLNAKELLDAIDTRVSWLLKKSPKVCMIEMDNGIEWVLFDMACAEAGIVSIPLPGFFTLQQRQYVIRTAGVDFIISEPGEATGTINKEFNIIYQSLHSDPVPLPENTAKITFTSGSTGQPKGVCLSLEQQLATAKAVAEKIVIQHPVHLCLLPLTLLLENIAGIYAPLLCGGTVHVPDQKSLGFIGSRLVEPKCLIQMIERFSPDSLILVPELLLVLVNAVIQGWKPPRSLIFIAVGGSRTAPDLLEKAQQCGLPVYQGYGLSECASVISLNTPADNKTGSIGKALSHIETEFINGELYIKGNTFLGYLHDKNSWYQEKVHTGDLVHKDKDNYLWFEGRKNNLLVSSFGRNINPEWPESEFMATGLLRQVVVLGDAKPYCVAIIVIAFEIEKEQLLSSLQTVNQHLPDYAQVKQYLLLEQLMTPRDGLYTENGRPCRCVIAQYFQKQLEVLYESPDIIIQQIKFESTISKQLKENHSSAEAIVTEVS